MKYRPEIDGLRALAVIPVILFHAGFPTFSGGFVGVDVFFVISGYLITSILLTDLDRGRFSLLTFYERRARRILPALFLTVLLCMPFAWMWLMTRELREFGASLVAVATFSSNILFWRESGYFETASELKPLLHTWSLAVEEQFYIFFPLALMACWGFGKRNITALLAITALASLMLAQWATGAQPDAGFFLLPTRAWELLLGSLLALHFNRAAPPQPSPAMAQALSLMGLGLILASILVYDSGTPFPGLHALVPTVGAALVIFCAGPGTLAGRLLGTRPMTFVGRISYSAYLLHFPAFAFARYTASAPPSPGTMAAISGLVLAAGWLSWKYVETPFRTPGLVSRRRLFATGGTGLAACAALGAVTVVQDGFPLRYTKSELAILANGINPPNDVFRGGTCFMFVDGTSADFDPDCVSTGPGSALVWGDSHAAILAYGLRELHPGTGQLTASGCPPLIGEDISVPFPRPHCRAMNDHILATVERDQPSTVYLHANWIAYSDQIGALAETVRRLLAAAPNTRTIVVGNMPVWEPDLPSVMVRGQAALEPDLYLANPSLPRIAANDDQLSRILGTLPVEFHRPADILCDGGSCLATVDHNGTTVLTVMDSAHMTPGGSVDFARALLSAGRLAALRPE